MKNYETKFTPQGLTFSVKPVAQLRSQLAPEAEAEQFPGSVLTGSDGAFMQGTGRQTGGNVAAVHSPLDLQAYTREPFCV